MKKVLPSSRRARTKAIKCRKNWQPSCRARAAWIRPMSTWTTSSSRRTSWSLAAAVPVPRRLSKRPATAPGSLWRRNCAWAMPIRAWLKAASRRRTKKTIRRRPIISMPSAEVIIRINRNSWPNSSSTGRKPFTGSVRWVSSLTRTATAPWSRPTAAARRASACMPAATIPVPKSCASSAMKCAMPVSTSSNIRRLSNSSSMGKGRRPVPSSTTSIRTNTTSSGPRASSSPRAVPGASIIRASPRPTTTARRQTAWSWPIALACPSSMPMPSSIIRPGRLTRRKSTGPW
ncbi:unknown [Megasphaera elsdenii CAG:570]|uniref:Uncharacterized protein n=1 Tax=Megasphaera elsdenii CAG:570 TaxID=1263087 RepID=R7MVB4_MEGEL|nr:unknown [Megasphaera elsdenii CAG:570]